MPTPSAIFIGCQVLAILISCLVGFWAVRERQRVLQQILATPQGEARAFDAYLRYVAERTRLIVVLRRVNTYILLIPLAALLGFVFVNSTHFFSFAMLTARVYYPLFLALVVGITLGSALQDCIGGVTSDAAAIKVFQVNNLQPQDILVQKTRRFLVATLPTVLYLEAIACILIFVNNGLIFFLLLQVFALLALIARACFAVSLRMWTTAVSPLEATEWAHLQPRITAWARIAGTEFAAVLVQQDLIGEVNTRVVGLRRPTIVLSESFLRHSDWRQQDAAVGIAVGVMRKNLSRVLFLYNALVVATGLIFMMALYFMSVFAVSLAYNLYDIFFALILLYLIVRLGQQYSRRFIRAKYFVVDRIASYLIGDPVAVMVALNTFNTLNGVPPALKSANVPSVNERIQQLDALVRTPWPRAAYAAVPVPSISPVTIDTYLLTAPFQSNRDVSPVPESAYVALP